MEVFKQIKVSAIQKAMQLPWLFTLLTGITFVDCSLMIQYGDGISLLTWDWIKSTLEISDILIGIGVFSFVFAALIPGFWFIIWPLVMLVISLVRTSPYDTSMGKEYKSLDSLTLKAAQERNTVLLKLCERHEYEMESKMFLSSCSQGMILFTLGAWFFSDKEHQPIIVKIYDFIYAQPWYIDYPASASIGLFCLVVFLLSGFMASKEQEKYMYYPE